MERDGYRHVFMEAPEALMIARGGVIAEVNHEAARLLGARTPEEVAGREMGQILPMNFSASSALHSAMAHISCGDLRSFDMEVSLPGPVFFPVVMRVSGLGGGAVAISLRDATHIRRLERDLQCAAESASTLVDTCPVPVFRIDCEYRFVQAGPSLSGVTGWETRDILGRKCHEILAGRDSVCAGCPVALSRISGAPVSTVMGDAQRQWRSSAAALGGQRCTGAVVFIEPLSPAFERSARLESPASGEEETRFDESGALETACSGPLREPFTGAGAHETEDSASLLAMVETELSERLGRRVRALPAFESVRVVVTGRELIDMVRRLADADFGTCLGRDSEIILRMDPFDTRGAGSAARGSGCLAFSMGTADALAGMSGVELHGLSRNPVFDAAPGHGTDTSRMRAFVARSRTGKPFYQVLLEAAGDRTGTLRR